MHIEHLAIWTKNLEVLKEFYTKYFNASSNEIYHNEKKGFKSYFLSFDKGARLEIMKRDNIIDLDRVHEYIGYSHMAISLGSKEEVLKLTDTLSQDGFKVVGEPRHTGDGYFESVVLDPDGNRIEITI